MAARVVRIQSETKPLSGTWSGTIYVLFCPRISLHFACVLRTKVKLKLKIMDYFFFLTEEISRQEGIYDGAEKATMIVKEIRNTED